MEIVEIPVVPKKFVDLTDIMPFDLHDTVEIRFTFIAIYDLIVPGRSDESV